MTEQFPGDWPRWMTKPEPPVSQVQRAAELRINRESEANRITINSAGRDRTPAEMIGLYGVDPGRVRLRVYALNLSHQFRILCFGLYQSRNVGVGVAP
jgi:hypothetical protein